MYCRSKTLTPMPNSTPQQRIDALVREFEEKFDECYPNMGGKNQSADIAKMFRQALKQAYLAGLEDRSEGILIDLNLKEQKPEDYENPQPQFLAGYNACKEYVEWVLNGRKTVS